MQLATIHIAAWSAWAAGLENAAQLSSWAANTVAIKTAELPKFKPDIVPAMLRRRLSPLGALAIQQLAALPIDLSTLPLVFASEHGELNRTLGLLRSLADEAPLSPMQFSLSVHNANAGILSIAQSNTHNINAVATVNGEIGPVLLEAQGILQQAKVNNVACVIYDEPLPGQYQRKDISPNYPYAVAFLLSKRLQQDGVSLSLELKRQHTILAAAELPQALALSRYLYRDEQSVLVLPGAMDNQWRYEKK